MAADNRILSRTPVDGQVGGASSPTNETPDGPSIALPSIRLPNAMVGRPFSADLASAFSHESADWTHIEMSGEAPAGLDFQQGRLVGTPEAAGEFVITYRQQGEALLPFECVVNLTINPNPRSLWKNIPSDPNAEFWKQDYAIDFLTDAPITVLGASSRGRSHAHVGSFRDDDMALAWLPGSSWISLTVADGAGSAKYSREGSKIACETMKAWFTAYFASENNALTQLVAGQTAHAALMAELYALFGNAALEARKAIDSQAAAKLATPRDFHTTLITALLHPLAGGSWFVASFSIGDGAAAVISVPGENPCLLTRPDSGEYAGQTIFLTMNEAFSNPEATMGRIQTAVLPAFEALILVTDGITDPRFESESALADPSAWALLWNELQQAAKPAASTQDAAIAILEWMEFHSPGHHDDRTLLLATPFPLICKP